MTLEEFDKKHCFCFVCGKDVTGVGDDNMTSKWKKVSKEEFYSYIKSYPRKLDFDTCGICEPPLSSYNDFTRGYWPDSMVAKVYRNDMLPEEWGSSENEYFIRVE